MKNTIVKILFLSSLFIFAASCVSKKVVIPKPPEVDIAPIIEPIFDDKYGYDSDIQKNWVDSVYNKMTFDERVGQLL